MRRRLPCWTAALLPGLLVAACHTAPHPLAKPVNAAVLSASCGNERSTAAVLSAALARGEPAESTPAGACLAAAAGHGSTAAALRLANAYQSEMVAPRTVAALGLDLFGRHIAWLNLAAQQGDTPSQLLLARETDSLPYTKMPDMTLAWYQTAAKNGNPQALEIIVAAYTAGRISDPRLYDFKRWLAAQPGRGATQRALRLLNAPPAHRLE